MKKLLLLTLLLASTACIKKTNRTEGFEPIEKLVLKIKEISGLPSGTAVAIIKDSKIIYEGYFGYADIGENKKVNENTPFYIASITKPMTALSSLLMQQNGDIKESTSMLQMFPNIGFDHINPDEIQLKNLMSHTGGIENNPFVFSAAYSGLHDNVLRHKFLSATLPNHNAKIGEFEYTNIGYNIFSVWIEDYFKTNWQNKLGELIYKPLEMHHTSSYISQLDVAKPYDLGNKNPLEIQAFIKNDSTMHAAGGTAATARDLAQFVIAQLNDGKVNGKQVFSKEVIRKSHEKLAVCDLEYGGNFKRTGYAWGWYMGPYKGEEMYHHFGGIAGTHSHISFIPKHNIGLVVLNNEANVSSVLTGAIADLVYSILLKQADADVLVDKHIKKLSGRISNYKTSLKKTQEKLDKRKMILSLDKSKYTGTYNNELLGEINISLNYKNEFIFTLGNIHSVATAYTEPDTLRVEYAGRGKVVPFILEDGEISGLNFFNNLFIKQ